MTALEITTKSYNKFEDKKDITDLSNSLLSIESDFTKRDEDGYKIEGEFENGVFDAVAQEIRSEFIANKRCSKEVREFCVELINEMKY